MQRFCAELSPRALLHLPADSLRPLLDAECAAFVAPLPPATLTLTDGAVTDMEGLEPTSSAFCHRYINFALSCFLIFSLGAHCWLLCFADHVFTTICFCLCMCDHQMGQCDACCVIGHDGTENDCAEQRTQGDSRGQQDQVAAWDGRNEPLCSVQRSAVPCTLQHST